MEFRTKLDFSSNRQVKQYPETITVLSGGTNFGMPFSALTTGPDLTTSGVSTTINGVVSTFSGNSATTVYTWYTSAMSAASSTLSAWTSTNSGTTQYAGPVFSASSTSIIDGNTIATSYSGISFDLTPIVMISLGGGNYSGTVYTNVLQFLSASTLDFTGRTIWVDVSGITRTERLIVTNSPQIGAVLTCIDTEGMASWETVSGLTALTSVWSAGTGISSAVLKNSGISSAIGDYSVSAGQDVKTNGSWSAAFGFNAIANDDRVFVFGKDITGDTKDTTYVDGLNIRSVGFGPGVTDIGVDANGYVVNQASDIKLKENITPITNALQKVLSLRGVTYNWKDRYKGGNDLKIGFIAQEVNNVVPELTYRNGELMGVHYKDTTALLVEAIKELVSASTINHRLQTQTVVAEDNNIELNFNGNHTTALGGGFKVLHGVEDGVHSEIKINENGTWETTTPFKPSQLIIPEYTPTGATDENYVVGSMTRDENYLYLKGTNAIWKKINLIDF